ncbi:asparagine-tRNA ligase [Kwoniella bestiolae CBS 10118]|uniref:Asparagine-tRNA ligase n=1 Tax=Kwoniella bestiolae CBS 10118 TaxID=1296100 RepID=A0A1B9G0E3_9TREE|nr:asparagine-tRNA ligase [Kwoniella bestiolae CBS 10118]OCF24489.1 asparagine-tRNA ligase [Kwoniella bestiolae CBS 10118]
MRRTPVRLSNLPPTLRSVLSAAQVQTPAQAQPSTSKSSSEDAKQTTVNGWIKSIRSHKNVSFAEINDGSTGKSLQAVLKGKGKADGLTNGTSVNLTGELKKSKGQGQDLELLVDEIKILGECDPETYPIQKKSLPNSVLRDNAHLRFRTSQTAAVMRIRDNVMRDWHDWFEETQFIHIHTPLLTSSDCEGAGEVFTLLDQPKPPTSTSSTFFPHPVHLTVSSQLHLEAPTHSLSRTYTLSPSFRAEPSLTSRHLSEFYMLEGELVIDSLDGLLDVVEDGIKFSVDRILSQQSKRGERVREDLAVISRSLGESESEISEVEVTDASIINKSDPLNHLRQILSKPFTRITYTQALDLLREAYEERREEGELRITGIPRWGEGLSTENEKWLANHFNGPVFVTRYPKDIKPFYMLPSSSSTSTSNEQDSEEQVKVGQAAEKKETVECFDLLLPLIGELAGGSLREHRLDHLTSSIEKAGMRTEEYQWYLDLRRFGSIPHGGWGMGWDRWISYVTGVGNVRDVVAYPRWRGHCKY